MAYTLGNKCAKNCCKRTIPVQLIVEDVVTLFLEHSVVIKMPTAQCRFHNCSKLVQLKLFQSFGLCLNNVTLWTLFHKNCLYKFRSYNKCVNCFSATGSRAYDTDNTILQWFYMLTTSEHCH